MLELRSASHKEKKHIKSLWKLSPCYLAFLVTTEVPEIYVHQFWNTITKIRDTDAYSFKLDKKKCRVDTEVFSEILQICSILPNQEFVALPSKEELLSFIKDLGYSGKCNMLSSIHTDQTHQPWRTFAAIINSLQDFKKIASPIRKLSPVKEAEPVKKAKRVKRPAKKSSVVPTAGVVIIDTPGESVSKKKALAKADRGKGIELLSDATLLEAA
ncbi:hypothetical protein Tco_0103947 [Tanacetum coccineum]